MKIRNAPIVAPNWKIGNQWPGRVGGRARREAVAEVHDQRDDDGGDGEHRRRDIGRLVARVHGGERPRQMAIASQREEAAGGTRRRAEPDRRDVDHDHPLDDLAERVAAEVGIAGRDIERREVLQQLGDVEAEGQEERPREDRRRRIRRQPRCRRSRAGCCASARPSPRRGSPPIRSPTKISPA